MKCLNATFCGLCLMVSPDGCRMKALYLLHSNDTEVLDDLGKFGGWAPLSKLVRDKSVVCTCQMEKKRVVTHGPLCRRTDFSFLAQMYTFVTT